jgi:hypothetical protein
MNQSSTPVTDFFEETFEQLEQDPFPSKGYVDSSIVRNMELLLSREKKLRKEESDFNSDFLAFMGGALASYPCACEKAGAHDSTPPMMWPELIACIITRAKIDAVKEFEKKATEKWHEPGNDLPKPSAWDILQ